MKTNLKSYVNIYCNESEIAQLVCSSFENYIYQSKYFQSQNELQNCYKALQNSKLSELFNICVVAQHVNLTIKYNQIEQICSFYLQQQSVCESVIIDFIGTNFGKKMHFGHLRSIMLGTILTNMLNYYGFKTETDSHFGDYGINLAIFIKHNRENNNLHLLNLNEILEIYKQHIKNINNQNEKDYTKELIMFDKKCNIAVKTHKILRDLNTEYVSKINKIFGTVITYWNGESDYINIINCLIKKYLNNEKVFYIDKHNRIVTNNKLVLTRSDKTPLYSFTDLATIINRIEKKYDTIIYLVDKRQGFHFEQIKQFVKNNIENNTLIYHLGFGFIHSENNCILKSRGESYNCVIEIINHKTQKYCTSVENIKMAFFLYELRHDIKRDYLLVDSILDDHIVKIIEFSNKLKQIKNSQYCCSNVNKCCCLNSEEKAIIKEICCFYENSIVSVNKLNTHLIYKSLYKIILLVNKYKKSKTSIILAIVINKLLKNLLSRFFDYNIL